MLVIAQQAEENDRQHKATGGDDIGHMPKHKAADCTDKTSDERGTREIGKERACPDFRACLQEPHEPSRGRSANPLIHSRRFVVRDRRQTAPPRKRGQKPFFVNSIKPFKNR
jgi:hypothetical protein